MSPEPPHVVLLAGGHGTRLGRDKPTLRLGRETLLQRHLRQALTADSRARFVVVANPDNIHALHTDLAAVDVSADVILQEGPDAHAAAATGLHHTAGAHRLFLAGITDLLTATLDEADRVTAGRS